MCGAFRVYSMGLVSLCRKRLMALAWFIGNCGSCEKEVVLRFIS